MKKPTRNSRLRTRPALPSPTIIRRLLFDVLFKHPDLLPFVIFLAWFPLRDEEAYAILVDPMSRIHGGKLYVPGQRRSGMSREIRITPAAWAWLKAVPGLVDRTRVDFRPCRAGKLLAIPSILRIVYGCIRAAGYNPDHALPIALLRRARMSAAVALCVPLEIVAYEAGHRHLPTLSHALDTSWSFSEAKEFFLLFPPQLDLDTTA